MVLLVLTLACRVPAQFDSTTYKNLTDLKPEVVALYRTFTAGALDEARVAQVALKLDQAYEYEKGKGGRNHLTVDQFEAIRRIFQRAVLNRRNGGKWTDPSATDYEKDIAEAFDLAIASEIIKSQG